MNESNSTDTLTRRSFLGWVIGALGGLIALLLGGSAAAYFVSPLFRRRVEDWVDIGSVKDFPLGVPIKVDFVQRKRDAWVSVERRSAAWVVAAGSREFIVYDPRCTHLGCPFRWDDGSKQFLCPCHTAAFGVDGKVLSGPPPRALDRFPAKVTGDRLLILPDPSKINEL